MIKEKSRKILEVLIDSGVWFNHDEDNFPIRFEITIANDNVIHIGHNEMNKLMSYIPITTDEDHKGEYMIIKSDNPRREVVVDTETMGENERYVFQIHETPFTFDKVIKKYGARSNYSIPTGVYATMMRKHKREVKEAMEEEYDRYINRDTVSGIWAVK